MSSCPLDTTPAAWTAHRVALDRMGPEERLKVALDLSEAVRDIHLAGLRARNPEWTDGEAVRHLVEEQFGIALPRDR